MPPSDESPPPKPRRTRAPRDPDAPPKPRKPRGPFEILELAGREVTITNPEKLYFPKAGITKLELVKYYVAVQDGALRGVARRPQIMKRFVNGVEAEPFYQKRVDAKRPPWIDTAIFTFPSGRTAEEIVTNDIAQLAWMVNLGCVDLNPHAIRSEDMDHPDELRIDLDPVPGVAWPQILEVGRVAREVLDDFGLVGWPKTSGSRGAHIWVRIAPEWPFTEVRRAGLAFAREVERRAPTIATAKWWKEERHGVFLDYNQNARDRTTASAYSVRPTPDARVSMPLSWDAFLACNPLDYTLRTVPALFAAHGDAHAEIDSAICRLEPLLELAARQETAGEGDAPWPPHFAKAAGEAPRVAPSRAKGGRKPKFPVITIAQAKLKPDALAGLERWKARHPDLVPLLAPEHILVDTNRGRATAWYRIRINLVNVPESLRPPPEPPDPDYDWKTEYAGFDPRDP
ncbi:MAG TPA: DNA primase small subunit domain-containing protein [Kofleriaceae bacterium]|nr:DNA primase small subunit domain-containing protein [Kofleriaceae bacterium]